MIINIFDLLFFYFYSLFYLLPRFKIWIELLDLSDSLKYFIPSESIWFPIPNIYSKERIKKMELILLSIFWFYCFFIFVFCFIYIEDSKFELNCWIWVIHLNISFLLNQFHSLFQIFIQKRLQTNLKYILPNSFDLLFFLILFFFLNKYLE